MTTVAVVSDRLLRLPMTVETRSVLCRRRLECCIAWRMADGAVVVLRRRMSKPQQSNHVLMPVVRKLNRELEPRRRITKRESHIVPRRRLHMTNRTDWRPCAAEELWPVTAHTCVVIRIIFDVRKSYFVAGVASGPVFLRGVGELRVINR